MSIAIRIHETGGPEVLRLEEYDPGAPEKGEVRVRHEAIGLNYIDVYHRSGLYPLAQLPATIGMEGAGVVEEIGPEVEGLDVGDRVAYAGAPPGAYAEQRVIAAHRLVKLPDAIDTSLAAAMMLKGMTARYLLFGCYPVKQGDVLLIHAAAGGVGSLACQWAHHLGATVIGTVGSEEKAAYAAARGCKYPILYQKEDFVEKVKAITSGEGVNVVYDSVGQATFLRSLACLKPMGTMVSFGQASGPVAPFDPGVLAAHGSLFLTRPSLMTYTAKREDLLAHASDLFKVVTEGAVRVEINQQFPLKEAADAHRALASRNTMGSSLLMP